MPKALVIDDELAITNIIGQFLTSAGFDTEMAMSGQEGLKKAVSARPEVIVVDIMMPEMDGYQVCQRLRRDPRTSRAIILALTARGQPVDKQMAFRCGADAHMAKPFKGKALVEEIQGLLAERSCAGPPLGYQVLVLRLKEKAGATMLASNLALCLAERKGCQVAIADMVFQKGVVHDRLGLAVEEPWAASSEIDIHDLASRLLRHESRLLVLPAATQPDPGHVAPATVTRILQTLRNWHDYVILDTAVNLGSLAPSLLRSSDLVLLVLRPEESALRQAQASLQVIRAAGDPALAVWPVLNMMSPDKKSLQEQAERMLGISASAVLPWSPTECNQALAQQRPVVLGQPESPLATAIRNLAQEIALKAQALAREGATA
jgi:pilus assembly protein CpaE